MWGGFFFGSIAGPFQVLGSALACGFIFYGVFAHVENPISIHILTVRNEKYHHLYALICTYVRNVKSKWRDYALNDS